MPTPLTAYEGTEYAYCPTCHSTVVLVFFEEAGKESITVCERCLNRESDAAPKIPAVVDDEPEPDDLAELVVELGSRLTACKTPTCVSFTNFSCAECGQPCCQRCLDNYDLCPRCASEYGHLFQSHSRYVH